MPPLVRSALAALVLAVPAAAQTPAFEVTDAANARLLFLDTAAALTAHGTLDAGAIPATGPGTRLMWWPARSAFRAGTVDGTRWDLPNVGVYSVAMGFDAQASGPISTAMGSYTIASGASSTALGEGTEASGTASFAAGSGSVAGGDYSTALGIGSSASGAASFAAGSGAEASSPHAIAMGLGATADATGAVAMGFGSRASGEHSSAFSRGQALGAYSTAFGFNSLATGTYSFAAGQEAQAIGQGAIALGYVALAGGVRSVAIGSAISTSGQTESVVIGGAADGDFTFATAPNQFTARFGGGYRLLTSNVGTTGVTLGPGQASWASLSDSTRKERFRAYDPAAVLAGLRGLRLGTWNYRGQDPATMRHWGPMAQDFHRAFGRDGVGVVGTDTTISTQDADGVLFAAAQALEARTRDLEARIESLETERRRERTLGGLAVAGLLGVGFVGAARRRRAA